MEAFKALRTTPDECQQTVCKKHAAANDDAWGSRLASNLAALVVGACVTNLFRML